MEQSILTSTKKLLNVGDDDTSFDLDIITHINSAFSILTDMGVGPQGGFVIDDELAQWDSYFPNEDDPAKLNVMLSKIRTVVWLRVKLLFDPPTSSFLLDATQKLLLEHEWRLNVNREETEWVDPDPPDVLVVDGGDPTGA
jgi:hypothetical protein